MEDWIIGIILALFVIVPCWLALSRRKEVQAQVEIWPELAHRSGLTYGPGHLVRGEYRGRSVRQYLESEVLGPPWTLISLQVRNSASFDLSISGYHVAEITSRNASLDHCFNSMGSPHEYVKAALAMIVCDYPYISAWMKWNSCSIKLDGEKMLWSQNSELTNVDDQIDLLNLLCDMAELAEKMGSELTGIDGGRN